MQLRPLTETFGVEVMGAPLDDPPASLGAALTAALHEHQLLLFRLRPMTAAAQLRFTNLFGRALAPWDRTSRTHPDDSRIEVFLASPKPGDAPAPRTRPAEHWHSDGSFLPQPTDATVLHAAIAPGEGGETMFNNTRIACQRLSDDLLKRVTSAVGVHEFGARFSGLRLFHRRVNEEQAHEERQVFPASPHPLVRNHPITGEPALYLNELCLVRIENLAPAESHALLADLYSHALKTEWQYTHRWREGDVLVWDNPSLLHRGCSVAPGHTRLVHRSTAQYHRDATPNRPAC